MNINLDIAFKILYANVPSILNQQCTSFSTATLSFLKKRSLKTVRNIDDNISPQREMLLIQILLNSN